MGGIASKYVLLSGALIASAVAQTQIDLRTQTKNVNFQAAPYTSPLQSGSSLPSTCSPGQLFFLTSAAAGANVYGCVAVNTWAAQGGSSGGGSGALTIDNNGTSVATRSIANFVPGNGIVDVITDTGTMIDIQQTIDSAVVTTRAGLQSGQTLLCASSSGSASTYTCRMTPTLTAYQSGMVLNWTPDVNGAGGPTTLNVDTLGAHSVKLSDGVTDPANGDVTGGRLYTVWFDGSNFRLAVTPMVSGGGSGQPACSSATRGRIWTTFGASGVKDQVAVCAKDATDTYAWRALY